MSEDRKPIYLDHAATTYLDPEVKRAMDPYWEEVYGNPSSAYSIGRKAGEALQAARDSVANSLGASPDEIFFTAGGTESINLAIFGVMRNYPLQAGTEPCHVITTAIEHSAVLKSCKELEHSGYATTVLPVDSEGFIELEAITQAVTPTTVLLSVMYANNEIGTIQPIAEIAAWLKTLNAERVTQGLPAILFHTDACQAAGALQIDVNTLGVDLMTINGSKVYGPKQTGALYVRTGVNIQPIIFGGGQEHNIRSGTENVPGVIGLAKALELAQTHRAEENTRLRTLRNYFWDKISTALPDAQLNGPYEHDTNPIQPTRLPNNVNISFKNIDGQALLLLLDKQGICVSTGSACSAKSQAASHVLQSIGCPEEYIGGSIRFSLGKRTTQEDIDYAITTVVSAVTQLQ